MGQQGGGLAQLLHLVVLLVTSVARDVAFLIGTRFFFFFVGE